MKKFFRLVLSMGLILSFGGCTWVGDKIRATKSEKIIAEINAESNFDLPLLTPLDGFDKTAFKPINGWMGAEEYYPNRYASENEQVIVTYLFSGYPDVVNDWVLTGVFFTDSAICLYGLTVDNTLEEWKAKLEEKGFEKADGNMYFEKYKNQSVSIDFSLDENDVMKISVRLNATNRSNIMY